MFEFINLLICQTKRKGSLSIHSLCEHLKTFIQIFFSLFSKYYPSTCPSFKNHQLIHPANATHPTTHHLPTTTHHHQPTPLTIINPLPPQPPAATWTEFTSRSIEQSFTNFLDLSSHWRTSMPSVTHFTNFWPIRFDLLTRIGLLFFRFYKFYYFLIIIN